MHLASLLPVGNSLRCASVRNIMLSPCCELGALWAMAVHQTTQHRIRMDILSSSNFMVELPCDVRYLIFLYLPEKNARCLYSVLLWSCPHLSVQRCIPCL